MEDYSKKTIKLLLERDRKYLLEILGPRIGSGDDLTVDKVYTLMYSKNAPSESLHESSIYTCECGSKRVVVREVQSRSADEGSSAIHICQACGKKW